MLAKRILVVTYIAVFPFDRPSNYDGMLNKIGIFTFLIALALVYWIATVVPGIQRKLDFPNLEAEIFWGMHVKFSYAITAALIALIARVIRLHDKLSDLLRIRATFDLHRILIPLAGAVDYPVGLSLRDKLMINRKDAMQRLFYSYASFEEPKIPKALVLAAIESWTWYWILLEGSFLVSIAAIIFLISRHLDAASIALSICIVCFGLFATCFSVCGRKADFQISEIAIDENSRSEIRKRLADMQNS